jgi:chorismate mutase
VAENTREAILASSKELLQQIVAANGVEVDDVAFILFTTTQDLNSAFPAAAAREQGWSQVALRCSHEMDVPGSQHRCLRVLMLVNTEKKSNEIVHVYHKGAEVLRPDLG